MDLDIEMGESPEETSNYAFVVADSTPVDDILQPDEPREPGEVADDGSQHGTDEYNTLVPTKIHIRGLDALHTDDLRAYVKSHFGAVDRVEWIDDTSANLVFDSGLTASEAIAALSSIEVADATALAIGETLPAKPLDGRPEVSLQVRFSLESDRKRAGAALRSRYYLLHPEHDPEERRRRRQDTRSKYRGRDDMDRRGEGRRRGSGQHEGEVFEASMYDDEPRPPRPRRFSDPEDGSRSHARDNRDKELFRDRAPRRDRSASPRRDDVCDRRTDDHASSSRHNRVHANAIKSRLSARNNAKELFPSKLPGRGGQLDQLEQSIGSASLRDEDMPKVAATPDASSAGVFSIRGLAGQRRDGDPGFAIKGAATSAKELFPDKLGGGGNAGKELLDMGRIKQRRKAQDLFS